MKKRSRKYDHVQFRGNIVKKKITDKEGEDGTEGAVSCLVGAAHR